MACHPARSVAPSSTLSAAIDQRHTEPIVADATTRVNADASIATEPDARPTATDAGVSPAVVATLCGVSGLAASEVHPLDRTVFPREQQDDTPRYHWRVPARLGWAAATSNHPDVLLLGAPADDGCAGLVPVSDPRHLVRGPFAGLDASDDRWSAVVYYGPRWLVAIRDERGEPRAIRDLGFEFTDDEYSGAGMGVWLDARSLFERGQSLLAGTYATADGDTEYVLRVLGVVGGELRELSRHRLLHEMGAPHEFDITLHGPRSGSPTIRVSSRRGRDNEDPDGPTVYPHPARVTIHRFDSARQRFR